MSALANDPLLTDQQILDLRMALTCLSQAESLVNQCASILCPLPGFGDEWSRLSQTTDAVRAAFHMVDSRRAGLVATKYWS